MSNKTKKIDLFAKPVEKRKKTRHVIPSFDRRNPDLHGHIYKPLDRRKQGDEHLLPRLRSRQLRDSDDYEMNDLPCTDYERMYET